MRDYGEKEKNRQSRGEGCGGLQITAKPLPVKAKQGGPLSSAGEMQKTDQKKRVKKNPAGKEIWNRQI